MLLSRIHNAKLNTFLYLGEQSFSEFSVSLRIKSCKILGHSAVHTHKTYIGEITIKNVLKKSCKIGV